jgi:hypothetical protein
MYAQEEQDGRDEEDEEVLEMPHVVNPMPPCVETKTN